MPAESARTQRDDADEQGSTPGDGSWTHHGPLDSTGQHILAGNLP
jgi:hypothetical protein